MSKETKEERKAPFVRGSSSTPLVMALAAMALLPVIGYRIFADGIGFLYVLAPCIAGALVAEIFPTSLISKRFSPLDFSFLVTGVTSALLLPTGVPMELCAAIGAVSILLGKTICGGLGRNFFNPAALGHLLAILLIGPSCMGGLAESAIAPTGTILEILLSGRVLTMFASAALLAVFGLADILMSVLFLAGFIGVQFLVGAEYSTLYGCLSRLLAGNTLFVALFMLADVNTSPVLKRGRAVYGCLAGIFAGAMYSLASFLPRAWIGLLPAYGILPVSGKANADVLIRYLAAILGLLVANLFVPVIDTLLIPKPFGGYETRRTFSKKEKAGVGNADEKKEEGEEKKSAADGKSGGNVPPSRPEGGDSLQKDSLQKESAPGKENAPEAKTEKPAETEEKKPERHAINDVDRMRNPAVVEELRQSFMDLRKIGAQGDTLGDTLAARTFPEEETNMQKLTYKSTRGDGREVTASQAILQGLADDGGLFVPSYFPRLETSLYELAAMDYKGVAYEVMKLFLSDFTESELKECINSAYGENFDTEEIAPIRFADNTYYLELFHGPTIAFKDMALQILPHLMRTAAKKNGETKDIVILTATSGDTGKAALAGFADVPGTKIIVFYPKDGVSSIQEKQMVTQKGANTCVIGIRGNFDDAQTGVKKIFTDAAVREKLAANGMQFSSANSINIGRLVPQIAYYVWAYTRLVAAGRLQAGARLNFCVPTGNFGNILAGYYAKQIGLPVGELICASNSNKVLYDFFRTGTYDRNREFILTGSPSMDILISSNLERLIYHLAGNNAAQNKAFMDDLSEKGCYTITDEMKERWSDFCGGYATEKECESTIRRIYLSDRYVLDPHTAVAACVYDQYRSQMQDPAPAVVVSTASPFKFEKTVLKALGQGTDGDDLALADALSAASGIAIPKAVESLRGAEVVHSTVCGGDMKSMLTEVEKFLGIPADGE